jgi:NitT/TauT family transport system ATP-binding protein
MDGLPGATPQVAAGTAAPPLLQLDDVSVHYGRGNTRFLAVRSVSLSVQTGDRVMLLGPSGCGKSTLLKVIAGFQPPSAGRVLMNGAPISAPGPERFVVFQEFDQLFPWKTVFGNVADCLRLTRGLPRAEARRRAAAFLETVGLGAYLEFYPHTLSGGMKQRVAIARAWSVDPAILLMDEPFAALDAQTRGALQEETLRIWQRVGSTLIFVTHSIDEALYLGGRIVVMGRSPGRVLQVLENPFAGQRDNPDSVALRHQIRGLLATPEGVA